jgi:hypothetical protein
LQVQPGREDQLHDRIEQRISDMILSSGYRPGAVMSGCRASGGRPAGPARHQLPVTHCSLMGAFALSQQVRSALWLLSGQLGEGG